MKQSLRSLVALAIIVAFTGTAQGDHAQFKLQWERPTPFHLPQGLVASEKGSHLFVAMKNGGVAVLDTNPSARQRQVAIVPRAKLGQLDAMNLERHGRLLYVALGGFFGRNSKAGIAIIDVKNPREPQVLSVWQSEQVIEGAAIVTVSGKYAYLGAMTRGVMTFDVSNPRAIKHLATMKPDIHFPKENPGRIGKPNARGMAVAGKLLFLTYDAGGLRVLDISNPAKPREVSQYINQTMLTKQQAYNNIVINGKHAYIAVDYAGMEIVDISNPRRVHHVGWWNPWKADTNQNMWLNSPGHTNQLHFDRKRKVVYLSAGDSELQMVNVSNPARPKKVLAYGEPGNGLGVWGLAISDGTVYLGYIKTFVPFRGKWSGVKAVRLAR